MGWHVSLPSHFPLGAEKRGQMRGTEPCPVCGVRIGCKEVSGHHLGLGPCSTWTTLRSLGFDRWQLSLN